MSSSLQTFVSQTEQGANAEGESIQELYSHFTNLVSTLPSSNGLSSPLLHCHQQGWLSSQRALVSTMVADARFSARSSDIIIATAPKSGTTWMKALLYTTVNRWKHPVDAADHPLNSQGPHEYIKSLEIQLYIHNTVPDLDKLPDPRLFSTHVPFVSLPRTIAASGCKIVYVCRDPKDALVSLWHFVNKSKVKKRQEPISMEAAVELFCDGLSLFGPHWDHMLGYWRAHLAHPNRVLFFRYEEMQRDPAAHVRRLAEFVSLPFGSGEEKDGTVEAVVKLCSFERMSELEVTKSGKTVIAAGAVLNSVFFRRGVVGDWSNYLSPEAARRIDAITEAKFKGSGLSVG